jgi:hypothetical protein
VGLPGLDPASMNSNDFRLALGSTELRSTAFTLARSGDRVTFTGRGYGHGVGMCVIGAGRRAARGESAAQILARYYPGLALEDVSRVRSGVASRETSALSAPPPAKLRASPPRLRLNLACPYRRRSRRPCQGARASPVRAPTAVDLERMAGEAQVKIAQRLGVATPALTIRLHGSIDTFRRATGQPWWVSAMVRGREIDLAPAAVLEQRDGLDRAVARAVAEALVAPELSDRHVWVRVGAARYFTGGERPAEGRTRCPADADLTAAVSAAAQREAESRAEACFAQALAPTTGARSARRAGGTPEPAGI